MQEKFYRPNNLSSNLMQLHEYFIEDKQIVKMQPFNKIVICLHV